MLLRRSAKDSGLWPSDRHLKHLPIMENEVKGPESKLTKDNLLEFMVTGFVFVVIVAMMVKIVFF